MDTLIAALLAAHLHARDAYGLGVALVTVPRQRFHSHGHHADAAVSADGEIVGTIEDRSGRVVCQFSGFVQPDGTTTLVGCGR